MFLSLDLNEAFPDTRETLGRYDVRSTQRLALGDAGGAVNRP